MVFVCATAISTAAIVDAITVCCKLNKKNPCPKSSLYNFELYLLSNIYLNEVKKKMKTSSMLSRCLFACLFSINFFLDVFYSRVPFRNHPSIHLPTLNARQASIQCYLLHTIIFKVQSNMSFSFIWSTTNRYISSTIWENVKIFFCQSEKACCICLSSKYYWYCYCCCCWWCLGAKDFTFQMRYFWSA